MSGGVRVREARPGDAPRIGALVGGVYVGEGWSPDAALPRLGDGAWVMAQGTALVAASADGLVGSVVVAFPGDPGRQIATDDELEFRLLAVDPAARGAGAGEALVRAIVERAREGGFAAVVLSTQSGMEAAQRLYGRLGFERQPGRDWTRPSGGQMLVYRLRLQ